MVPPNVCIYVLKMKLFLFILTITEEVVILCPFPGEKTEAQRGLGKQLIEDSLSSYFVIGSKDV